MCTNCLVIKKIHLSTTMSVASWCCFFFPLEAKCALQWCPLLTYFSFSLNDRDALKLLEQKQKGQPMEAKPVVSSPPTWPTGVPLAPASSVPLPASRPHVPVSIPGRPGSAVITGRITYLTCLYKYVKKKHNHNP